MISPLQSHLAGLLLEQAVPIGSTAKRLGLGRDLIETSIKELVDHGMPIHIMDDVAHLNHHDPIHAHQTDTTLHFHYPITTSTQNILQQTHPRQDKFVIASADFQSNGRGRHGRKWLASYGNHILMSLIIPRLESSIPQSLLTGYIIKRWLTQHYHIPNIMIKWPNDIIISELKLCGIIHEAHPNPNFWVLGIGINVHTSANIRENITQPTTSLEEILGIPLYRQAILQNLIQTLYTSLSSSEAIQLLTEEFLQRFPQSDYFLNKPIFAVQNQSNYHGIGRGINEQGHYLLETFHGTVVQLHSASIRLERRTSL